MINSLFAATGTLDSGDLVGFTFFIGFMAMTAASVFFFIERGAVLPKWRLSVLVSALITGIAAVHYYYMKEIWISTGTSPTEFRYIDWTLTVPLMCVEFYLILRYAGASLGLLWRLIGYSVLMLVAGYIGESPMGRDYNLVWGVISTLGWAGIIYEIFLGEARKVASASDNPIVKQAFGILCLFVLIGWGIYPIGYMTLEGNLLHFAQGALNLDVIYNVGDAINKIGFGLVIWNMARAATEAEIGFEAAPAKA